MPGCVERKWFSRIGNRGVDGWRLVWIGWSLVIALALSWPWKNFVGHAHWAKVQWIPFGERPLSGLDIAANVVLFVPFGYACARWRPAKRTRAIAEAALWALLLSAAGEFFQVFCHNRFPSLTDVCTNCAGATMGAVLGRLRLSRLARNQTAASCDGADLTKPVCQ
jgi:glycopeptide antibiotics resistance protein